MIGAAVAGLISGSSWRRRTVIFHIEVWRSESTNFCRISHVVPWHSNNHPQHCYHLSLYSLIALGHSSLLADCYVVWDFWLCFVFDFLTMFAFWLAKSCHLAKLCHVVPWHSKISLPQSPDIISHTLSLPWDATRCCQIVMCCGIFNFVLFFNHFDIVSISLAFLRCIVPWHSKNHCCHCLLLFIEFKMVGEDVFTLFCFVCCYFIELM